MELWATINTYDRKNNILYIVPFLYVAKCMGIAPNYDRKRNRFVLSKLQRYYSLSLLLAVLLFCCVTSPTRLKAYSAMNRLEVVVDVLSTSTTLSTSVTMILSVNFWNYVKYQKLLNMMIYIDSKLGRYGGRMTQNKSIFFVEIFAFQFVTLSNIAYDVYLWFYIPGGEAFRYYMGEDIFRYHVNVILILIYNLILWIKYRLERVNKLLEKSGCRPRGVYDINERVSHLGNLYITIGEMILMINVIFGYTFLFIILSSVASFLITFNIILSNGDGVTTLTQNVQSDMIYWLINVLCMIIVISSTCDRTTREAKSTCGICFKLIQTLSKSPEDELVTQELLTLAKQSAMPQLHFSAAGFFKIDYNMLYTMINLMTSYIVVLIQFNK